MSDLLSTLQSLIGKDMNQESNKNKTEHSCSSLDWRRCLFEIQVWSVQLLEPVTVQLNNFYN